MGFAFGEKKSDVKESSGIYLRTFKKGDTKVRFLQEPGDWYAYREHFSPDGSFPCTRNRDTCPGCTSDSERVRSAPRRYGTFVFFVDRQVVLPVKIGQKLSERLETRAERNGGSLLTRDYIVIRTGSDLGTDYDVDQDAKYDMDTEALWKQRGELEAADIVERSFVDLWGDPEKFGTTMEVKRGEVDVPEGLKTTEERESSGLDEFAPKPDEEMVVAEADLKKMTRPQLVEIYNKAGFSGYDDDWGKDQLVQEILKRADA